MMEIKVSLTVSGTVNHVVTIAPSNEDDLQKTITDLKAQVTDLQAHVITPDQIKRIADQKAVLDKESLSKF